MKICVYGAGSIGGYLAVELALAGVDVTVIARGPQLEAMRKNGLTLLSGNQQRVAHVACTDNPSDLTEQDYVFITLKSHSFSEIADQMLPLLGPETAVVTMQNGIPWWYFYGADCAVKSVHLETIDPDGRIWKTINPKRAIGTVVYPSCEITRPGVVRHLHGNRMMVGEPDGSKSPRVVALAKALTASGFKAPIRQRIRDDIWLKLWGNVAFNPISVLTHSTLKEITDDTAVRAVIRSLMIEAQLVGEKFGIKFSVDVDKRIEWAAAVGDHKTSMLQDLEMGRKMEIDALVGSVVEMGGLVGVPTPTLDMVLGLVRLRSGDKRE